MSKYFSPAEFRRCTPSCTIEQMDPAFLDQLDRFREFVGIPLALSCAYRSRRWELSRGRTGSSAHTKGKAVDIVCNASATRWKIVSAAIAFGFRRIGIGKTFIHLDNDDSLPQQVMWHYY